LGLRGSSKQTVSVKLLLRLILSLVLSKEKARIDGNPNESDMTARVKFRTIALVIHRDRPCHDPAKTAKA
jgi:hypothetical protein